MRQFEAFDASEVPLEGSNLIEASAGTGKTYSIAILTLRLILENQLTIKEILMVTFTKAAVAELEERVRLFIRQAYKVSQGEDINDQTIATLVHQAILNTDQDAVHALLKEAVLFLDETAVLTIHSFCQQSLNEFAFETGQLFGADLLQDTSPLLEEEMNIFWRKRITGIPVELLSHLGQAGLSRGSISAVVNEHLGGKRYFMYNKIENYRCSEEDYRAMVATLQELTDRETALKEDLLRHVRDSLDDIEAAGMANTYCRKSIIPLLNDPLQLLDFLWEKRKTVNVSKTYPDLLERIEASNEPAEQRQKLIQELIQRLNCHAINEAIKGIEKHKRYHNQLSYEDLIVNLHGALVKRDNPQLIDCLQQKYKAVFIDEFQDTDRLQYEIFEKAFGKDTILFYIGDPKQSIYAWRKADIFTYFKAQKAVDRLYGMNQNYRSSEPFIKAMNLFFKPDEDFDTFHFQGFESAINYIEVDSPLSNRKGSLIVEGDKLDVPISITESPKKEDLLNAVVGQVMDLLTPDRYFIHEKESKRPVRPADIGILVEKNKEGREVKDKLSKYGIPAVTIGDAKVLQTEEARYLLYLLEAIVDISIASINKALLSPFTGFNDDAILSMDEEQAIGLFRSYKAIWEKDGIYTALHTFIQNYKVKQTLLSHQSEFGERIVTNLYQLIELLHKMQSTKRLSPLELIGWLKRGIEGYENVGDEFEQRIESDEDSIKIVTIHKSKGLEYNIVLAPFLDLVTNNSFTTGSYRDPESGEYVSLEKTQMNEEQMKEYTKQLEQEHRRLIYVAITRAVYKCFIFRNAGSYAAKSSLVPFVNSCKALSSTLINFNEEISVPTGYFYSKADRPVLVANNSPVHFKLLQPYWRKMSYSMLSADHQTSLKSQSKIYGDKYDEFIFSQLTKGAKTGNMLHSIFENIAFNHSGRWDYAIKNAVERYAPLRSEIYTPMLKVMLEQVLNAKVRVGIRDTRSEILGSGAEERVQSLDKPEGEEVFKLADIDVDQSIHELEFDFTVSPFQIDQLAMLSDDTMEIRVKDYYEIEGVMNGMIDLFFECNGKYYVLDWKSNFLGDSLADYSHEHLQKAMSENNYHLQYMIYTLAIKKYLESRLPDFDYETQFGGVIYMFLRGLRKDAETGVFTFKPPLEKIERLDGLLSS